MSKEFNYETLFVKSRRINRYDVLFAAVAKYLKPEIKIERVPVVPDTEYFNSETTLICNRYEGFITKPNQILHYYTATKLFIEEYAELIFPDNTEEKLEKFKTICFAGGGMDRFINIFNKTVEDGVLEEDKGFNDLVDITTKFIKHYVHHAEVKYRGKEAWKKALEDSSDGIIVLPLPYPIPEEYYDKINNIYFSINGTRSNKNVYFLQSPWKNMDKNNKNYIKITPDIEEEPGCIKFMDNELALFSSVESARNAALKLMKENVN